MARAPLLVQSGRENAHWVVETFFGCLTNPIRAEHLAQVNLPETEEYFLESGDLNHRRI